MPQECVKPMKNNIIMDDDDAYNDKVKHLRTELNHANQCMNDDFRQIQDMIRIISELIDVIDIFNYDDKSRISDLIIRAKKYTI